MASDETSDNELAALRAGIDEIDDQLHDLLMRRVQLSEQIGRVKSEKASLFGLALRPVREIAILRRLWNRHKGALDKDVLIRIWREILSASVNIQSPMTVAVNMPERGCGNLEIARDYFGCRTSVISCQSVNLVLKELMQGEANIGVLSLHDDKLNCWWYSLSQEFKHTISVFLRLPLIEGGAGRVNGKNVYALAKIPFEKSGADRTLLVAETDGTISLGTLDLLLKASGIPTNVICDTYSPDLMKKAYLFEIEGFLSEDDDRLSALLEKENGKITMLRVIGGYPVPLTV